MNNRVKINLVLVSKGLVKGFYDPYLQSPKHVEYFQRIAEIYELKMVDYTDKDGNLYNNVVIRKDYNIIEDTIEELMGYYEKFNKDNLIDNYKVNIYEMEVYCLYKKRKIDIMRELFKFNSVNVKDIKTFYKEKIEYFKSRMSNNFVFKFKHEYYPSFKTILASYEKFQKYKNHLDAYIFDNWFINSKLSYLINNIKDEKDFDNKADDILRFFDFTHMLIPRVSELKTYYFDNSEEGKNMPSENLISLNNDIIKLDEHFYSLLFPA